MRPAEGELSVPTPRSELWQRAVKYVAERATGEPLEPSLRVTLNFHPDRLVGEHTVIDRLAQEWVYASQFVTGVSNGGLTAYPGGDRWRWESRIFGGTYDHAAAWTRPVYGGLDHHRRATGAAPRFGSAYLRLSAETLNRATFCYPDSVAEPNDFGVAQSCALLELADQERESGVRDTLDDYVEAQVHGPVALDRDVEALVLDPSFRGTCVEDTARALPCPVEWHGGYRLSVPELRRRPLYRGPQYVELGCEIAEEGWLNPRMIGDAARAGRFDAQSLKKVWHCLARFGAPASSRTCR